MRDDPRFRSWYGHNSLAAGIERIIAREPAAGALAKSTFEFVSRGGAMDRLVIPNHEGSQPMIIPRAFTVLRRWVSASIVLAMLVFIGAYPASAAPSQQTPDLDRCAVSGTKTATPARVRLGQKVQIRLTLSASCPEAEARKADVVLAIDHSRSMLDAGKLTAAKAAARQFIEATDLSQQRVAVVGFYGSAVVRQTLTDDEDDLLAAIDGMAIASGTDLSAAIDAAQAELDTRGRADAIAVIILMTDGDPNSPISNPITAALRSANAAKLAGTVIYSIGLGTDLTEALLIQVASSEDHYFFSPGIDELEGIYASIALVVGSRAVRAVGLDDVLSTDVELVAGTASPSAAVTGRSLAWTAGAIPAMGLEWVYEVTPKRVGSYPTNDSAEAGYLDIDGESRTFVFPKPMITVLEPEPPTCGARDSWTVLVHSFPDSVGVSTSAPRGCNLTFDSGDWATGIYYRMPSLEYVLTDETGTKELARGTGVYSAGKVDQRLYFRVCQDPPYKLRLLTTELDGYRLCPNAPVERLITIRDFRPLSHRSTQESFGFIR